MRRNTTIDLMRFIGILLIMFAHVNPPNTLFQIRTFDVPMMVFVSGMSYYTSGKTSVKLKPYILSRFKRLVLPVWAFLVVFFVAIALFHVPGFQDILTAQTIFLTFLLSGFHYVWVIKIFLLMALLSPLLTRVANAVSSYSLPFFSILLLCVSLLLSLTGYASLPALPASVVKDIIIPAISYGAIFIIGYKVLALTRREISFCLFNFVIVFLAYVVYNYLRHGGLDDIQNYKYPPTLYYIAYATIMSLLIFSVLEYLHIEKIGAFVQFVSANTIWIYLWHIPVVEAFHREHVGINVLIKYLMAVGIAVLLTRIQVTIVGKITGGNRKSLINTVFTG